MVSCRIEFPVNPQITMEIPHRNGDILLLLRKMTGKAW